MKIIPAALVTLFSSFAPFAFAAVGPNAKPICSYSGNFASPNKKANPDIKNGDPLNDPVLNYCVGGSDCSPFNYKPYVQSYSGYGPLSWTRYNPATGYYDNKSQQVWATCNEGDKSQCDGYWVFHSGDGAGIEDDCVGDISYTERMGRRLGVAEDTTARSLQSWCRSDKNGRTNSPICFFVHPGSKEYYSDYAAGWISYGNGGWGTLSESSMASAASGGWNKTVQKSIMDLINDTNQNPWANDASNIQLIIFPWVCARDGRKDGNNFSYPTLTEQQGHKCYADNEPGSNGWPPVMEIYSMKPEVVEINGKSTSILDAIEWTYDSDMQATDKPRYQKQFKLYKCEQGDKCPDWK
jgi:hypothetical protein